MPLASPESCPVVRSSHARLNRVKAGSQVPDDEVRKLLGLDGDSSYRWIERRALPTHRIGRLWKFKLTEVDDWVRTRGGGADEVGEKNLDAQSAHDPRSHDP